ncbi:MAG: phosphotransferase [Gammaproteobacteria bacterium]|nr:phosphotransferase [Gammaproteobacteria bacterium]
MDDPAAILHRVKPCLAEWNLGVSSIEVAAHAENVVYKVVCDDQREYALRVHRPGYHTLDELIAEQMWTAALHDYGVKVPQAFQTVHGDYYTQVKLGNSTRYVGLVEWLDAQPMRKILEQKPGTQFLILHLEELGRIAGHLHNQATAWQVPEHFVRHSLNVEGLLGESPFWGRFWEIPQLSSQQRDRILTARTAIIEVLETYGENPRTYSMIHADLHQGNLLVTDAGIYVIDFDDAGFGWHLYDLAVALYSYQDRFDFDELKDAIIRGYRDERSISDADLSLLPLFLLIRSMASMGWVNARPELEQQDHMSYLIGKVDKAIVELGLTA